MLALLCRQALACACNALCIGACIWHALAGDAAQALCSALAGMFLHAVIYPTQDECAALAAFLAAQSKK